MEALGARLVYLPYTKDTSSTMLREKLKVLMGSRAFLKQALDCNILRKVKSMERAQRILKKFSKILKEQGAGAFVHHFQSYVTYSYDRWKVRRLRKFPRVW